MSGSQDHFPVIVMLGVGVGRELAHRRADMRIVGHELTRS
jgi:hypothetical protein